MGSVYRETFTKPLPVQAEVFTRNGEQFARWTDRKGRKHTAKVTTPTKGKHAGADRILVEARTYTAKYRDGSGHVRKVATGCRAKDAAETVLAGLSSRADKVRCGAWTAAEDNVLDWQSTPMAEHIDAYLGALRTKKGKGRRVRVSAHHARNVEHNLRRIVAECGFGRLRDVNRHSVERWADRVEAEGKGARTINAHLSALTAFANWAVEAKRMSTNPISRLPKRDEKADGRRTRRALSEAELVRLLKVAWLRPLAEYGRKVNKLAGASDRRDKKSRRTWTRAPLEFADLDAAMERARTALHKRPDFIAELERRGRERALMYKVLVLTGLRKGELAALTVGHVELEGVMPYLILDAADEKAGRGAEIPLRADLAGDLGRWIADLLTSVQSRARAEGMPIPVRLAREAKLFNVPTDLIRVFDRDLVVAGIARIVIDADGKQRIDKRDDRGRTVDVHSLRTTFGTHLSRGGVAPRTAQAAMRHSKLDLTMSVYTDPRLLDVAGALSVLPALPLADAPDAERQRATGTLGPEYPANAASLLVPGLVPNAGNRCTSGAIADKLLTPDDFAGRSLTSYADKSCARQSTGGQQRATRLERATFSLEG